MYDIGGPEIFSEREEHFGKAMENFRRERNILEKLWKIFGEREKHLEKLWKIFGELKTF